MRRGCHLGALHCWEQASDCQGRKRDATPCQHGLVQRKLPDVLLSYDALVSVEVDAEVLLDQIADAHADGVDI